MIVYETKEGAFTHHIMEIQDDEPWPENWVAEAPPATDPGQTAVWDRFSNAWSISDVWPTPEVAAKRLTSRKESLKKTLQSEYERRLYSDVLFDFTEAVSITDATGAVPESRVLAMQMSPVDQDNWRTKWSEALSSTADAVLVIVCEDRWYVAAHPALLIQAFLATTQVKQMLLSGLKTLERLLLLAQTQEELDNIEQAINNPIWGIA